MTDIKGLGYLRVQTQDVPRWRELVVDGLGFATGVGPDPDALYLRMDERRARLIVLPGDVDKVPGHRVGGTRPVRARARSRRGGESRR